MAERIPDSTRETILRMWNAGKTAAQISAHYGGRYSRSAIAGLVHRSKATAPAPDQVVPGEKLVGLIVTLPAPVMRYLRGMPGMSAGEAAASILAQVMADDMRAAAGQDSAGRA